MNAIIDNIKEKVDKFDLLNDLKIDQIAIATKDSENLISLLQGLGLREWTRDEVVATGSVRKLCCATNKAKLAFNYEMGIEFEVLEYVEGASWHDEIRKLEGGSNFLSHIGYHLKDFKSDIPSLIKHNKTAEEKLQELILKFGAAGYEIAQEVMTESHTNPYLLEQKRKYHYVIFDTREALGFDIKLIVRRENV